jgi:hypothetical protein
MRQCVMCSYICHESRVHLHALHGHVRMFYAVSMMGGDLRRMFVSVRS